MEEEEEVRNNFLPSYKEIKEKQTEEETFAEIELFQKNNDILGYAIFLTYIKSQIETEMALAKGVHIGLINKVKMNNTAYYLNRFNLLLSEFMVDKQIKEGLTKPEDKERIDKLATQMADLYKKHIREFFQE